MTEQDILNLVNADKWMMDILHIAEKLNLPDWAIGAGFIRNKVWDCLHGISRDRVDTAYIDLIYFDPNGNDESDDKKLSEQLKKETGLNWEIVNQIYAHKWNNLPPYESTKDAISKWPETATATGIKIENGQLKLIAPYGINDLVNLIVRPSPKFISIERVKKRVGQKKWLEKWPKLNLRNLND